MVLLIKDSRQSALPRHIMEASHTVKASHTVEATNTVEARHTTEINHTVEASYALELSTPFAYSDKKVTRWRSETRPKYQNNTVYYYEIPVGRHSFSSLLVSFTLIWSF